MRNLKYKIFKWVLWLISLGMFIIFSLACWAFLVFVYNKTF